MDDRLVIFIICISVLFFYIAGITLFIAYLRGPNIQVVIPVGIYSYVKSFLEIYPNTSMLGINLLFVNMSNRSGILYDYDIPKGDLLFKVTYDNRTAEKHLPQVIELGGGFEIKPTFWLKKSAYEDWSDVLENREHVNIMVVYKTNSIFPWKITKKTKIKIDIKGLKKEMDIWS